MAGYIGKFVEIRCVNGVYKGTVVSLAPGKVMLEDVEFMGADGILSSLPRVRIPRDELVENAVKILDGNDSEYLGNDPVSLFNKAEQRIALSHRGFQTRSGYTLTNSAAPLINNRNQRPDWTSIAEHVFPSDDVFDIEYQSHQTRLNQVGRVRDMNNFIDYCVFSNPLDREFAEAINSLSGSIARVGLGIFGSSMSRTSRPAFISVSTPRGVFIFDIRFMNSESLRNSGLTEFLQRPANVLPKKIMCDCRLAADSLKHCFNVELSIYCDLVGMKSCLFMRDSFGKVPRFVPNLFDLLYEFLPTNRDLDLLEHRFEFACFDSEAFNIRPAKQCVIHLVAAATVHLSDLFDCMMQRLMDPIVYASRCMLNSFQMASSAPFVTKEAVSRMPDGIAQLAGPNSQYVNNVVGRQCRDVLPNIAYRNGLLRCGLAAYIASINANSWDNR